MRKGDFEDLKAIEEYVRRKEEEYRKRVEEEERKKREAIEFVLNNSFILGTADIDDELTALVKHRDRLEKIQKLRGLDYRIITWNEKVIAIPREVKASFSLTIDEILRNAKRFGESLAFFEEVEE